MTPRQHDAYRAALFSVRVYEKALAHNDAPCPRRYATLETTIKAAGIGAAPSSMLAKNAAFVRANQQAAAALSATGMWQTP